MTREKVNCKFSILMLKQKLININFLMLFFQEIFGISSRGKEVVYSKGGGDGNDGESSEERLTSGKVTFWSRLEGHRERRGRQGKRPTASASTPLSCSSNFYKLTSEGQAACMIIENQNPLPSKPRQNHPHQDTTQRLLNHLVLPKHRTSKFSRYNIHINYYYYYYSNDETNKPFK